MPCPLWNSEILTLEGRAQSVWQASVALDADNGRMTGNSWESSKTRSDI